MHKILFLDDWPAIAKIVEQQAILNKLINDKAAILL